MPRRAHTTVANLRLLLPRIRVTHAAAPLLPRDHAGHDPTVRNPAVFAHAGPGTTPGRLTVDHAAAGNPSWRHSAAGTSTGRGHDAIVRNATIGSPSVQNATTASRTVHGTTAGDATIRTGKVQNLAIQDTTARDTTVGNLMVGRVATRHVSTRPANHQRRTLMTAPAEAGPSVAYRNRQSGFDVFIGHSRPTSR
ncbi:hypothetical protein AB0C28_47110 [Nonomuraea sp. NPDC048892]|uniref:hypothetical protein n=1 Tax=Nonomuraea sp. NPDC048892 TaxID=3154624 RepID=UPI0033D6A921